MNHSVFKQQIKTKIGKSSKERPFICDGYPLDTELFIIGINPATTMDVPFFKFWENDMFDKNKWFNHYKKTRVNEHYAISPTRRKIESLVNNEFKDFKCLETNLYHKASKSISELSNDNRNSDLLLFLIETIKPKALFLHGRNPEFFIKDTFDINVESSNNTGNIYMPHQIIEYKNQNIVISAISHLRLTKGSVISENATELVTLMGRN